MKIEKYGLRNWAVYDNSDELVCVTVYKKGALEVIRRLDGTFGSTGTPKQNTDDIKKFLKEIKLVSSKINEITKELNLQLKS
ncbi:MAG: hypothetical protein ACYDG2_18350 [Ruminiclostridium sp.]